MLFDAIEAAIATGDYTGRKEHVDRASLALVEAQHAGEDPRGIEAVLYRMTFAALAMAKVLGDVAFDATRPEAERRNFYVETRRAWTLAFLYLSPPWMRARPLPERARMMEALFPWTAGVAFAGTDRLS